MKLTALLCAALLLGATAASAQVRTMPRIEPIQARPPVAMPIPAAAAPEAAPSVAPASSNELSPSDLEANTEEGRLKQRIRQLEREKAQLEKLNAGLETRVRNFTVLGGSEVHAYCSADTVSNNTAGASENCGAYSCDKVSGLCRTTCSEAMHCLGANANCSEGHCTFAQPPLPSSD